MAQLTIRAHDDLVERLKAAAQEAGRSMNAHIVVILDAATDPERAGSEAERIRERLRRADLLIPAPADRDRRRPPADPEAVAAAGRRAARGTPLSELVVADRT